MLITLHHDGLSAYKFYDNLLLTSYFLWIITDVKDANTSEELVLNTVATLNNLSFYNDADSVVQQRQVEITESKLKLYIIKFYIQDK